ncbi:glycosyltransferase family 2 protein [Phreatobacter sp. AB_2022a]|uniref:glycosyltransferase family 2 protein n=1 Tax=Phreatobacter sp. AB_2022a TaxID=3003134 RepID=UPI0022870CA3|nr:glycosyltransferase family 2 protein [Phreatobacter sp. AB_2022a]MCZ0736645.1 glycosyltransferase family 2 protein [Phreatobacter sp. AB_2022a]
MDVPLFTVLLPVNRSPELLPLAIESVLTQSEPRFELFVICDGPPRATVACAEDWAARDPRIRVFDLPKGERHGEAHRHRALEAARGVYVAQLGDDDLWFPDHLMELASLLDRADFGNLLQADIAPDGAIHTHPGDLADPAVREAMLTTAWNFFGPSCAGYRLEAYRRLPVGWSPAPPDVWTDLFMWRKFLIRADLVFVTRPAVQCARLPASLRQHLMPAERAAENQAMAARFASRRGRADFQAAALASWNANTLAWKLGPMLAASAGQGDELQALRREHDAALLELEERLQARQQAHDTALCQQNEQVQAWRQAYETVLASTSWKITAPMRRVARALGRRP